MATAKPAKTTVKKALKAAKVKAKAQKVALVPFFLKGVADGPEPTRWFQPDRIHPNPRGVEEVARRMLPPVQELLFKVQGG